MSERKSSKRPRSIADLSSQSPQEVRSGLFNCYEFLAPNEYSERTFGVLAWLVRNSVGEINFSSIIDEVERRGQRENVCAYSQVLERELGREYRECKEISLEKCLMMNRWISQINQDPAAFLATVNQIKEDMTDKMSDKANDQTIRYPDDFRQRESDFARRKHAQDFRRLFYLSHSEAQRPPSLIHLQNRTTEHLNYFIQARALNGSKSQDIGIKELLSIIDNSFMITVHPCNGSIPIVIYKKTEPEYNAKLTMTVVSLLHDFMKMHPNVLTLKDIKISLLPTADTYKLKKPKEISWEICELQGHPKNHSTRMYYAKLPSICIVQTNEDDTSVQFAQKLHQIQLTIDVQINCKEYNFYKTHSVTLTSLPFAIAQRTSQIPRLLAGILLCDIRRYCRDQSASIEKIVSYLSRYFAHRTGVLITQHSLDFLQSGLNEAKDKRSNFTTDEERFTDFLASYVHQVEFMVRHPVLAMFYNTKVFLGICDSERVKSGLEKLSKTHPLLVAFRLNSIRIDYNAIGEKSIVGRVIEPPGCAFRVDIFNHKKNLPDHFTLDPTKFISELNSLIYTTTKEKASETFLLSSIDRTPVGIRMNECRKYYGEQLTTMCTSIEPYKPLDNIIDAVDKINRDNPNDAITSIDNEELVDKLIESVVGNEDSMRKLLYKLSILPSAWNMTNQAQASQMSSQHLSATSQSVHCSDTTQPQVDYYNLQPDAQHFYHNPSLQPTQEYRGHSLLYPHISHQQQQPLVETTRPEPVQVHVMDGLPYTSVFCSKDAVDFPAIDEMDHLPVLDIESIPKSEFDQYLCPEPV
ncbi:unnamed protein product [Adineta ricciae]|uniref:Uncharacterized protein n=1 Tax=Adineta ricciae TaxID=249248 RepID=A0A814K6S5_ADIRI|nr:unnamed protein product [Adineta ricciae]CAF1048480.1 unnamed protein product [Adineta ricciae]